MAATTKKCRIGARKGDALYDLIVEHNNLITAFDAVLAKLDLDGGVTDANYATLHGSTAAKIGNMAGTAIS